MTENPFHKVKPPGVFGDQDPVHNRSDLDSSPGAHHHTLGPGPHQAAPGNHNHGSVVEHTHDVYALLVHTHGYSLLGHNHNTEYSVLTHDHAATYSVLGHDHVHNHDAAYSATGHNHDAAYSVLGHAHVHNHDTDYATVGHTHPGGGHDHDTDYADIVHTHVHNHDADYSDIVHDHAGVYSVTAHDHAATYSAIAHNHDADYSDIVHNHDADYSDIAHAHRPVSVFNASVSAVTGYNSDTYLVGSSIAIPANSLQAKSMYKCKFNVVKTNAGTATPIINIRIGIAGSTADTSRGTLTFSGQTNVVDEGTFEVICTFRTVGAGTAVLVSVGQLNHRLPATGLGNVNAEAELATSAGFDSTVANSIIGLSVNGGASASWTVSLVQAELLNIV